MDPVPAGNARAWRPHRAAPASAALAVTSGLGTAGWFAVSFAIGTTCTNDFSCGTDSCAPCAKAHTWVGAGGIGQWALAGAALAIVVLSRSHPGRRPAATVTAWALIPLAIAWFALFTVMAWRSF